MEPIIITIVCFAIALAFWLLLKLAAQQDEEPTAKPPPPFRRAGPRTLPGLPPGVETLTVHATDSASFLCHQKRIGRAVRKALTLLLLAITLAIPIGCGAREHRDNLGEVRKLKAEIAEREAAEERKRKAALAEAALDAREARKEIQDAKRVNNQVIAEMEAAD